MRAAQPDSGVLERQAALTELSANTSATTYWVAEADGAHAVTTIDIVWRNSAAA